MKNGLLEPPDDEFVVKQTVEESLNYKARYGQPLDYVDLCAVAMSRSKDRLGEHPEAYAKVETRPETPGRVDVTALNRRLKQIAATNCDCNCGSCSAERTRFHSWVGYVENLAQMCRLTDINDTRPAPWDIWWKNVIGAPIYIVEVDIAGNDGE